MKEQDLINCGFKKKKEGDYYWYELKIKKHKFITNDALNNDGKDYWFIGYTQRKDMDDIFWFNEKLSEEGVFKIMFRVLTGLEFKLAYQRNLVR